MTFTVRNTGTRAETVADLHPVDASASLGFDIFRLAVSVAGGEGWSASLPNTLVAIPFGESAPVTLYVSAGEGDASISLTATSEGDPTRTGNQSLKLPHSPM